MPTKRKPKFGWKATGFTKPHLITEDGLLKAAKNLGIPIETKSLDTHYIKKVLKFIHLIEEAVVHYIDDMDLTSNMPRKAEVKPALELVEKKSKELCDLIKNLDDVSVDQLTSAENELFPLFNDGESDIFKLNKASTKALNNLGQDKGGPLRYRRSLQILIIDLENIFFEMTGKKAPEPTKNHETGKYQGEFFHFVDDWIQELNENIQNSTLAAQIKTTLQLSKKIQR
jgi:hypothetical protein